MSLAQCWKRWSGWFYYLAARLWLECMDAATGEVERARIAVRRDQCIGKGNGLRRGGYAGICATAGVVYD